MNAESPTNAVFGVRFMTASVATPLAPHALYQAVAERLREQIFARTLAPGSRIDEPKLVAEFGISRTPLREALKVLAVEGLVTMKVRRGAYVTEMSERDVTDIYHLLGVLESDAAASAALSADADQLHGLRALHDELEASVGERTRFFALNEAFHLRLLAVADNRWRTQLVGDLRKMMKLNRHHSLFREGRIEESLREHRALMAALQRRDAPGAATLMRAHFRNGLAAAVPGAGGCADERPAQDQDGRVAVVAPRSRSKKPGKVGLETALAAPAVAAPRRDAAAAAAVVSRAGRSASPNAKASR